MSLSRTDFCKVYVPMAKAGKSALEIGKALGIDKPDNTLAAFVSQKASNYRRELREAAIKAAEAQGLDEEATNKLVAETVNKLPKLKTRTRQTVDFVSFLDELLAECDNQNEE